jgi:hypothetical protein
LPDPVILGPIGKRFSVAAVRDGVVIHAEEVKRLQRLGVKLPAY